MDDAKRSVNCAARDFLAFWWRGDAGSVPCGDCPACCYYAGIPVDKKRDRKRLPHLLTERNRDDELVLRRRPRRLRSPRRARLHRLRAAACGLPQLRCRAFSAMGLVEHCDPNHQTPGWEFDG
jgi:hypothetical protein